MQTRIRYALLKPAAVNISIFNALGQKIRTLVNGDQPPGSYQIHWDGRDDAGREVASGMYSYRIQADDFVRSHRMTLIK